MNTNTQDLSYLKNPMPTNSWVFNYLSKVDQEKNPLFSYQSSPALSLPHSLQRPFFPVNGEHYLIDNLLPIYTTYQLPSVSKTQFLLCFTIILNNNQLKFAASVCLIFQHQWLTWITLLMKVLWIPEVPIST